MLYDPIPDPIAAGWTKEGQEPYLVLTNSLLISDNTVEGFCQFFSPLDATTLSQELTLSPSVLLSPGYTVEGADGTGVHVTIDDGRNEIRATVLSWGAGLRVALKAAGGGHSNGLFFPTASDKGWVCLSA